MVAPTTTEHCHEAKLFPSKQGGNSPRQAIEARRCSPSPTACKAQEHRPSGSEVQRQLSAEAVEGLEPCSMSQTADSLVHQLSKRQQVVLWQQGIIRSLFG